MKFSMIAMILSLTLLASCNGGGGGGSKSNKAQSPLESNSTANSQGSGQAAPISSMYAGNCEYDSDLKLYRKNVLSIIKLEDNTQIVLTEFYSADKSCRNQQMIIEFPVEDVFEANPSMYSGYADRVLYRPKTQAMAEELNKDFSCETNDWEAGVAIDVTGSSCVETGVNSKVTIKLSKSSATATACNQSDFTCNTITLKKI